MPRDILEKQKANLGVLHTRLVMPHPHQHPHHIVEIVQKLSERDAMQWKCGQSGDVVQTRHFGDLIQPARFHQEVASKRLLHTELGC